MKTLYKVLSYIGIFWIFGLILANNDKKVRFHVGQGMVLTFVMLCGYMLVAILQFIIKVATLGILGFLGKILYMLYLLFMLYFIIIGISNALADKSEPLPTIGKYAFYK